MSTRPIQFLKKKATPFEVVRYAHEQKGAEFAARAIGFQLAKTVKTLVVDAGGKHYFLALMPGDRKLSLKRAARALGVKRAAMVDTSTAERLTGYLIGGISPFGTKAHLPSVMDEPLMDYEKVAINGGQRGVMLLMSPADIVAALGCRIYGLSRLA